MCLTAADAAEFTFEVDEALWMQRADECDSGDYTNTQAVRRLETQLFGVVLLRFRAVRSRLGCDGSRGLVLPQVLWSAFEVMWHKVSIDAMVAEIVGKGHSVIAAAAEEGEFPIAPTHAAVTDLCSVGRG